jgi:AcrR family transcriptional regulator
MTTDERREPNPTQVRILEAAFHIWEDEPATVVFGGLTVARLAKAAGVTRATFYSYWPSLEDYLGDLLDHLATLDPDGYRPGVSPAVQLLSSAGVQIDPDFYEACAQQFQAVMDDPAFRLRLAFFSKWDDPVIAAGLRRRYRIVEQNTEERHGAVRASWGREIRPPFTVEQVHATYNSVMEGLAMRRLVDPDLVPVELYGKVTLMLTMFMTRRIDDPRSADDLLDAASSWPAVGMRLRGARAALARTAAPIDVLTARRVTEEARRLQASMGWHELTLTDISQVMGLSEESVLRAFGSKAGMATAIFMLNLQERYERLLPTGDPATDLRHMLQLGLEEIRRSPGLTQSVVQILVGNSTLPLGSVLDWDPTQTLIEQMRLTQDAGQLDPDLDPVAFAMTLSRIMLMESQPGTPPLGGGLDPVELLLRGAGVPVAKEGDLLESGPATPDDPDLGPDPFLG